LTAARLASAAASLARCSCSACCLAQFHDLEQHFKTLDILLESAGNFLYLLCPVVNCAVRGLNFFLDVLDRTKAGHVNLLPAALHIRRLGLVVLRLLLERPLVTLEDAQADTQIAQGPLPGGFDVRHRAVTQ
jgi:hypothetical protein